MTDTTKATSQISDDDLLADSIVERRTRNPISHILSSSIVYVDSTASVRDVAVQLRTADVSPLAAYLV